MCIRDSVRITAGLGSCVSQPSRISESYQEARQAFALSSRAKPVVTISDLTGDSFRNSFNISLFRNDLTRAFEEFDTDVLYSTLTQITELFAQQPMRYLQAVDGACNILYLALSLLPDGSQTLSQIFASYGDGYRSIYRMNNVEQVEEWRCV